MELKNIDLLVKYSDELPSTVLLLDDLQASLFKEGPESFEKVSSSPEYKNIVRFLKDNTVDLKNVDAIKKTLSTLRDDLVAFDRVKVSFAREDLSESFWDKFYVWIKDNLNAQHFLVERSVDPSILGGAVLVWNGKQLDLSLKSKLASFFASK